MRRPVGALFFSLMVFAPVLATADVLIPDLGDLNCDGDADVLDVQMAILSALGLPINPQLDQDADGAVDACEDYAAAVSGDCGVDQVIKWNGTVWACAEDVVGAVEPGEAGPPGPSGAPGEAGATGADGKTSLIELGSDASACPSGGKQLFIGIDSDGNGALAATEISHTIEICDGLAGPEGPKGDKGDTGVAGPQGPKGDTGATGPAGAPGGTAPGTLAGYCKKQQGSCIQAFAPAFCAGPQCGCESGYSVLSTSGGIYCMKN